jgi:aromatic ring-opening dioxygenase catalytic subunit (LigB family)
MGKIVGAFGVPHYPRFPLMARENTPLASEIERLYGEVAGHLRELEPDVLVIFSSDHFQTFVADIPIFSIGVAESTDGPCDQPDLPAYKVPVDYRLAQQMQTHAVKTGFDVGMHQEFALDHTFMVPYHFIARDLGASIVPVFISGLLQPTPTAQRCFDLGARLREAIETTPDDKRVAIVGSGSFSLDLGGIHEGASDGPFRFDGVTDSVWVDRVVSLLSEAKTSEILEESTDEQMGRAGNIGGELLNWIAMLGTFDAREPDFLERQGDLGHAYGAWKIDGR